MKPLLRLSCYMAAILVPTIPASAAPTETTAQKTVADFEGMAEKLGYLDLAAVLYDRYRPSFVAETPGDTAVHNQILVQATGDSYSRENLLALLSHPSPKVRSLAAVALFDREDPSVLPDLLKLSTDQSPSFDGHCKLSESWLQVTGIGPPEKNQTVGSIVTAMLNLYMQPSGFHSGILHPTQPSFAEYWKERQGRSFCAGWFALQLARAHQEKNPPEPGGGLKMQALRKRLDALSPDERTWTLLWLNDESSSDVLVQPEDLLQAAKKTGPEKLLRMLEGKIPSDDPDLQSRKNNNWFYERMQLFVLQNARELLRVSDADFLLASEGVYRRGWWAIAAAHLQPAKAAPILHAALKRFPDSYLTDDRTDICIALWELCGESESAFLVDWFYSEDEKAGSYPNPRGRFLLGVEQDVHCPQILAALVADPRFEKNDPQSTGVFVRTINSLLPSPLLNEDKLRNTYGPSQDQPELKEWKVFIRNNISRISSPKPRHPNT